MHFPLLQLFVFKVLTFDRLRSCIFVPCMLMLVMSIAQPSAAQSWLLTGNNGTLPTTNFVGTKDSRALAFRTNNVERMRILAAGRVGIGSSVTQAGFALTINPASAGSGIYINDPGGGNLALGTKSGNTGEGLRMNISSTSNPNAAIRGHTDGNGFGVLAEATGPFGFGIEAYSSQSFGVWGGTGNSNSYAAYFSGNVFCSGSYVGSDQNLKQNIQDYSGGMNVINQLHPKQFQYRHDGYFELMNLPKGDHCGLIAQDVEQVLPDLVKDTRFEPAKATPLSESGDLQNSEAVNFKALNYTELIPIMIKALQEQQQEIEELKRIVESRK